MKAAWLIWQIPHISSWLGLLVTPSLVGASPHAFFSWSKWNVYWIKVLCRPPRWPVTKSLKALLIGSGFFFFFVGGEAGPHFTLHHKQIKLPRVIRLIYPDTSRINYSISTICFGLLILIREQTSQARAWETTTIKGSEEAGSLAPSYNRKYFILWSSFGRHLNKLSRDDVCTRVFKAVIGSKQTEQLNICRAHWSNRLIIKIL